MKSTKKRLYFTSPYLGSNVHLTISEERVGKILQSFEFLGLIALIEEKFDILMENYLEYEGECIRESLRSSALLPGTIPEIFVIQRKIDRKYSNFLSSCRMYLDHLNRILSDRLKEVQVKYEQKRTGCFETSFSYRLLEYLRNATQHRFLPFGFTINSNSLRDEKPYRTVYSFSLDLLVKDVLEDKELKKKFREELESIGDDSIKLNFHTRTYLNSIGEIHELVRRETDKQYAESRSLLEGIFSEYKQADKEYQDQLQNALTFYESNEGIPSREIGSITDYSLQNTISLKRKFSVLSTIGYRTVTNDLE